MPFPPHLAAILDQFRIAPDTKAALYDLYLSLGNAVLDAFADLAERFSDPATIQPGDLDSLRASVVERYVRESHPKWVAGQPTRSLWHPRSTEGRAAGLAAPLGRVGTGEQTSPYAIAVEKRIRAIVGPSQPVPSGIVVMGRDAHYGGRAGTISFDIVVRDVDEAVAVALADGQQHTIPGSVGATSGSADAERAVALLWEVQPNAYKPAGERNRAIAKVYRRHRNWHVASLAAALEWLDRNDFRVFVLRGTALQAAHEVNWRKPVTPDVVSFHDRTVGQVVASFGYLLAEISENESRALLESGVLNAGLTRQAMEHGVSTAVQAVRRPD